MNITEFHEFLNDFLNETGMSKNSLANDTGVSQSQVSDWSNGKGVRFTPKARAVVDFIENYRNSTEMRLPERIEAAIRPLIVTKEKTDALEGILMSLKVAFEK